MDGQAPMSFSLRRATIEDADEIAALFSASFRLLTFLPPLHTLEEDRAYVRDVLLTRQRVTVAEEDGRILGFMAETEGWINQLYVRQGLLREPSGPFLLRAAGLRRGRAHRRQRKRGEAPRYPLPLEPLKRRLECMALHHFSSPIGQACSLSRHLRVAAQGFSALTAPPWVVIGNGQ
jgi:hypothetical protein